MKLSNAVAYVAHSQFCLSQQNMMPKWFKYINQIFWKYNDESATNVKKCIKLLNK